MEKFRAKVLNAGKGEGVTLEEHPIHGALEVLLVALCYDTETGTSSGLMSHSARMQVLPTFTL